MLKKVFKYGWLTPIYISYSILLTLKLKFWLKVLSFKSFKKAYDLFISTKKTKTYTKKEIKLYVYSLLLATKILNSTCLVKSLVLKYYLRKDKRYQLQIGVNIEEGFSAHAWLKDQKGKVMFDNIENNKFSTIWNWM